jgi:hypothetical protein
MSDTPADKGANGSQFLGISIRAWLALLITGTVCANWTANTVMVSLGYTSANIVIPEPLYSVFVGVIGIYFGQQLKK